VDRRGLLFIPFFDEDRLVNLITLEDFDFFSKQPDYKKCAASISRVTA
jgi:nitrate reductase NapA